MMIWQRILNRVGVDTVKIVRRIGGIESLTGQSRAGIDLGQDHRVITTENKEFGELTN